MNSVKQEILRLKLAKLFEILSNIYVKLEKEFLRVKNKETPNLYMKVYLCFCVESNKPNKP